jgi:hypothetical protein
MLPEAPGPVARQLAAYNARDLAAFAACYTDDVILEDVEQGVFARSRKELEARYGKLFHEHPENKASVTSRSVLLPWVFEEEVVERDKVSADGARTPTRWRVFVVYKLAGELVARATFYRGS